MHALMRLDLTDERQHELASATEEIDAAIQEAEMLWATRSWEAHSDVMEQALVELLKRLRADEDDLVWRADQVVSESDARSKSQRIGRVMAEYRDLVGTYLDSERRSTRNRLNPADHAPRRTADRI